MVDRIERLREAARSRHDRTLRRAEHALATLARSDEPVTVRGVAEAASVSRSWLYRQPELLDRIDRLRHSKPGQRGRVPAEQMATVDSLRQQLSTYREEVSRLRAENQALRDQLARHLGAARARAVTTPDSR